MTNHERILSITDTNKKGRLKKIAAQIHLPYETQLSTPSNQFNPYKDNELINIIVPSRTEINKIVLMAHWDTFPQSPAYNDNSTGVVTLLRLQDNIPDNVELVFTDLEECGGQGCRLYMERCIHTGQFDFEAINLDVVGLGDTIFYEEYAGPVTAFEIPKHLECYNNIPFSDSRMLERYKIPNILLLTGESSGSLIVDIFEAQHNNINDGKIELINEEIMDKVFETVQSMITKKAMSIS